MKNVVAMNVKDTYEITVMYGVHAFPNEPPYPKEGEDTAFFIPVAESGVIDELYLIDFYITLIPNQIEGAAKFLDEQYAQRLINYTRDRNAFYGYDDTKEYRFYFISKVSDILAPQNATVRATKHFSLDELELVSSKETNRPQHYYWLNVDPNEWALHENTIGEPESFFYYKDETGKRTFRFASCYREACVGDIVICFQTRKPAKILSIGKISKRLDDINSLDASIEITKYINLTNGVSKDDLRRCGLGNIFPVSNGKGTLFELSPSDYSAIIKEIERQNPGLLKSECEVANLSLGEWIEQSNLVKAISSARINETYYLCSDFEPGSIFTKAEFQTLLEKKQIIDQNALSRDNSPILVAGLDDDYITWVSDRIFAFWWQYASFDDSLSETMNNNPSIERLALKELGLGKNIHLFSYRTDNSFVYNGVARLSIQSRFIENEADPPKEFKEDGLHWYWLPISGALVSKKPIAQGEGLVDSIEQGIDTVSPGEERDAVVKVRINQSAFRKKLLAKYPKCCICGLSVQELLVASHIKPWSKCEENVEKTDINNGLILCPTHDKLFDRGLITFEKNGKIRISPLIKKDLNKLNIETNASIQISDDNEKYMSFHRKNNFRSK